MTTAFGAGARARGPWFGVAFLLGGLGCNALLGIDDATVASAGAAGGGAAGAPQQGQGGGAGSSGRGGQGGGGNGGGGAGCEAPRAECGGVCISVESDAKHCGDCDYACGVGSACVAGACAPEAVVSGVVAPYAFVLDAGGLYFVSPVLGPNGEAPPAVQKVGPGSAVATPLFGAFTARSRSIALANGALFFSDLEAGGRVYKGLTDGDGVNTHTSDEQPSVQQLAAQAGQLWWGLFDGTASRLRRCPTEAIGPTGEEMLPPPNSQQLGRTTALALEGESDTSAVTAYWVTARGTNSNDNGVWRKVEGAAPEALLSGDGFVAMALGQNDLFVATASALGAVSKAMPLPAPTPLPGRPAIGGAVQGLTASGERLYWLAYEASGGAPSLALHRSALDGSGARVLGRVPVKSPDYWQKPVGAAQLTVDGGFVYFADPGTLSGDTQDDNLEGVTGLPDGAIYRLPE